MSQDSPSPSPSPLPSPLLIGREGAVTTLQFNRPAALNAIDVPMAQAFLAAVKAIAEDDTVRAVLLRGSGKGFMAGGDLALLQADPLQGAADLIGPLHEAVALLATLDTPVVAQVHGVAAGAGLSLMLQADFVLCAEGTRFNLAYVNLGASCDVGASWALPRWVGLRRALEIAMLGDMLDAAAAERMGLVNRVLPADALADEAMALAQRLAAGPTVALGQLRRLMRGSFDRDLPA
ncbi:MAG: enoyl-CoA hydratase/isomerase family protein, partial [Comamonadaceae bacterium]